MFKTKQNENIREKLFPDELPMYTAKTFTPCQGDLKTFHKIVYSYIQKFDIRFSTKNMSSERKHFLNSYNDHNRVKFNFKNKR